METNNANSFVNIIKTALKGNKTFKVICSCIIIFILAIILFEFIKENRIDKFSSYQVTNENVDIKVNLKNVAHVTDTYKVTFSSDKSNFEIVLPFKSNYDYVTKIKNIKVDGYKPIIIRKNDYISINVNVEKNENEIGKDVYERLITLSYIYDRGDDNDEEFDHLDYYLTSPLRPFKISTLEFNIELPRNTKSSIENIYNLFIKENTVGTINNITKQEAKILISDNGTIIQGKINNGLSAYEGLLLKHDVYEDYFEKARNEISNKKQLIVLYIIFFFVCFINYFICGKDSTILYTSDDSIPNEISPLISSLLLAKTIEEEKSLNEFEFKHLSSLIVKWANNGYLNVERIKVPLSLNDQINNSEMELRALENINNISQADKDEKDKLFKNNQEKMANIQNYKYEFRFRKLKDVMRSEMPYFEKAIFDSLFVMTVNGAVDTSVIKANLGPFRECILYFRQQLTDAKGAVLNYVEALKKDKYDERALRKNKYIKILGFTCWTIAMFFQTLLHYKCMTDFLGPLFFLLLLFIYYFVIISENNKVNLISTLLFTLLSYFMTDLNVVSFILLSSINFMAISMRKYSFKYELIIEKIKGFKKFVCNKRRVKIVNALNDNPKYFYEALPHAIALGINTKLIKKCEEFKIAMPGWLIMQPDEFSLALFYEFTDQIDNTWNEIINNTF